MQKIKQEHHFLANSSSLILEGLLKLRHEMNTKQNHFSPVLFSPKICEIFCANIYLSPSFSLLFFFSSLFFFILFSSFLFSSFSLFYSFFFSLSFIYSVFVFSLFFFSLFFCFRFFSFLLFLFLSFVRTFYEQSIYIQQKTQIKREKSLGMLCKSTKTIAPNVKKVLC